MGDARGEERSNEVVEHLQAAAIELIAAARAFLDVTEELVKEPGQAVATAAALAKLAGAAAAGAAADGRDTREPKVERIRVS